MYFLIRRYSKNTHFAIFNFIKSREDFLFTKAFGNCKLGVEFGFFKKAGLGFFLSYLRKLFQDFAEFFRRVIFFYFFFILNKIKKLNC